MCFVDGEASPEVVENTLKHLDGCNACQEIADDIRTVSAQLLTWEVEPTSIAAPRRISDALDQQIGRQSVVRSFWSSSRWRWALAGTMAIILATVVVWQRDNRTHEQQFDEFVTKTRQPHVSESRIPIHEDTSGTSRADADLVRTKAPLIVRTAELSIVTKEFDRARPSIEEIVKKHQGYLGKLNVNSAQGAARTLEAVLRVPAEQRDATLAELRKLGRVESESQTGEEVTQQYLDLEARLVNDRNAEQRMTELLRQRTAKLSDVVEVEREITGIREEIERMEAERKALVNRVDFATLNVKINEQYTAQLGPDSDSVWGRLRNAAIEGYRSAADMIVAIILALLSYGPSVLSWAAVLFVPARVVWRKARSYVQSGSTQTTNAGVASRY